MRFDIVDNRVKDIRRFNRLFTRQIGVLREGLLHSPYSLTESRIIFETAQRDRITASDLCRELGLDAGYVSRLLSQLEQQGIIERVASEQDARQRLLRVTEKGQNAFALLDERARAEVAEMLSDLSEEDQQRLTGAMRTIEGILERSLMYSSAFVLRPHEPGDMGWVVHRHGVLYAQEYGWDERFEALVAQIVADFINHFQPERERCWIAEMDREIVGCVFCVQVSETVAKLRLLLVEPKARGLGLGTRLVEECIRFARRKGYSKLVLWTNDVLIDACKLYQKAGFQLVSEGSHNSFGHDLVEQTWELDLLR